MRSPTLLLIRMNAAETSASSAMADWMLLTVVSRSRATAVIDTFMIDVSTTRTNIAIANSSESRGLPVAASMASGPGSDMRYLLLRRGHPASPTASATEPKVPVGALGP